MAQTFVFEELDDATREYLTAVRDSQGEGAPGVFVPTSSAMAGCGCVCGLIVVACTLIATLTTWVVDVVYQDPGAVAMLQTAGLLIGGWLIVAAARSSSAKGDKRTAGFWVYADALHLFQAYRETVTVTDIADVTESNFTHNYNDGSYQNSVVRVRVDGQPLTSVTLKSEAKAEQLVVFLNYLAWARSPDGKERASLTAAQLGGLARYVSEHDTEPKDADDNLDFDLVNMEPTDVPEEPAREGRAAPSVLPYFVIIAAGAGIFLVMWKVVNPPLRDNAIFEAVTTPDQCTEPLGLRAYLLDDRNTRHVAQATARLERIYADAVARVRNAGANQTLREGTAQILDSVKGPVQPTVSLKVTELQPKAGAEARVTKLRDDVVGKIEPQRVNAASKEPDYYLARGGIYQQLGQLMGPVQPPPNTTFPTPRTAVGLQLIEFADKPEDAEHAHFEIKYEFVQIQNSNKYGLEVTVEFRPKLDAEPVETYKEKLGTLFGEADFARQADALADRLVKGMVGGAGGVGGFGMPPGGGFPPGGFPNPNQDD